MTSKYSSAANVPNAFRWGGQPPKSLVPFKGSASPSNTHLIHSAPKRHLGRFSRFCRVHERDQ